MERHGAIGRFRMCAGLMLRRHALKVGHVDIDGKKIAAPGAKKRGRKAKGSELNPPLCSSLSAVTKSVCGVAFGYYCELKGPNENKISYGYRDRASPAVEMF
jgi:hypothetical protein